MKMKMKFKYSLSWITIASLYTETYVIV